MKKANTQDKEDVVHKKIGIIGGLSPESTLSYYQHITRSFFKKFGTYDYPEIIIYSVNLQKYHLWRENDRWDLIEEDLTKIANKLDAAGADIALIATNTMHKVFEQVQSKLTLPLINIINTTASEAKQNGVTKVALLGTKFTMQENFYIKGLEKNGLCALVPSIEDQEIIHRIIVEELVCGIILDNSKSEYLRIINKLKEEGANGVILGCTEIPLLIKQSDCDIPVIDTATIHTEEALRQAIEN